MPRMVLALRRLILHDFTLRPGTSVLRTTTTGASREDDADGQDPQKRTHQPVFLNECFHVDYHIWFVFGLCLLCVFSVVRLWFSKIIRDPG